MIPGPQDCREAWNVCQRQWASVQRDLAQAPLWLVLGRPRLGVGLVLNAALTDDWLIPPLGGAASVQLPFWTAVHKDVHVLVCERIGAFAQAQAQNPHRTGPRHAVGEERPVAPSARDSSLRPLMEPVTAETEVETETEAKVTATATAVAEPPEEDWDLVPYGEAPSWEQFRLSLRRGPHSPALAEVVPPPPMSTNTHTNTPIITSTSTAISEVSPTLGATRAGSRDPLGAVFPPLRWFCEQVRAQRHPFCGINGVVAFLPWDGLARADLEPPVRDPLASALEADLVVIQEVLGVYCPILFLVADCQEEPGFRRILRQADPAQRDRTLGVTFPSQLAWAPDALHREQEYQRGALWLQRPWAATLVHHLWQTPIATAAANPRDDHDAERDSLTELGYSNFGTTFAADHEAFSTKKEIADFGETEAALQMRERALQRNAELWEWRVAMHRRVPGLVRLMSAVPAGYWLTGYALTATGPKLWQETAFVAHPLQRLLIQQNAVAWAPPVWRQEQRWQGRRRGVQLFALLLILANLLAAIVWLQR